MFSKEKLDEIRKAKAEWEITNDKAIEEEGKIIETAEGIPVKRIYTPLDLEEKNYHRARCTAKTKTGTRCKRFAMSNGRCKSHGGEGPLAHGRGGRKPVERLRIIKDRIEKAIKKGQKRAAN